MSQRPDKKRLRDQYLKRFAKNDKSALALVHPTLDETKLVADLLNFIAAYPDLARKLFDLHGHVPHLGSRLGRGEVLVWFLYEDVMLGGSSSNHDVLVNGDPRVEIKVATREGNHYDHFLMGLDEVPSSLRFFYKLLKLFEKNDRNGKIALPQNFANINKSKIDELKVVSLISYKHLEDKYFEDLLAGKIGQKTFLFFDQVTNMPIFFGKLKRENLKLTRISGGLVRVSLHPTRNDMSTNL
jgi:hypothetical protein